MTDTSWARQVIANDLSASAAEVMRKNVEINGLGEQGEGPHAKRAKVQVNEGDAWWVCYHIGETKYLTPRSTLMYNHRTEKNRVDVVDLDPYGTAAPFIDAAVQSVNDGGEIDVLYFNFCLRISVGLLCVTCTDLSVLATTNYPEKWCVTLNLLFPNISRRGPQLFKLRWNTPQSWILSRGRKPGSLSTKTIYSDLFCRHCD